MSEQIPRINASAGPFSIDVVAWWIWWKGRKNRDRVAMTAQRFLSLFETHGVAATQIQHFLPELTFDKVQKPESLLPALSIDVLDRAAKLFGVRREWLEGADDQIYDCFWCDKHPEHFFEKFQKQNLQHGNFPVHAFTCVDKLDYRGDRNQYVVLVFVEKIREIGDVEIFRYVIDGDGWDWGYRRCRIQLKAMVRVVDRYYGNPVPLYRVQEAELEGIREGRTIPRLFIRGTPLTDPSLEDYVCAESEHGQAKECDELPDVKQFMLEHKLPDR